jgi:hypothetical protein
MEEAALLSAGERSDRAIIADFERRRMVRGEGRPDRGRGLAEEDDDEYQSRMDWGMPEDVIAAMSHQVTRDKIRENICAAGAACTANKQLQRDRKRNLMKEFCAEIGRGSFGRAEAKGQIEKYKKRRGRMVRRPMTTIAALNLILRNHSSTVFWNVTKVFPILNLSMSSKGNC